MTDTDDRTPWQVDRDRAEETGTWPESWGPFHRHFANDAIHRDGGPECDQPGTPRRVYVFDPDALAAHEAAVAQWAVERAQLADVKCECVISACECGGLAHHKQGCRWRYADGSHVIAPGVTT